MAEKTLREILESWGFQDLSEEFDGRCKIYFFKSISVYTFARFSKPAAHIY